MIVVKVELWPHGDESAAREIGRLDIANVGGSLAFGDYEIDLHAGSEWSASSGVVEHHDRTTPVWNLIAKALQSVGFGGVR